MEASTAGIIMVARAAEVLRVTAAVPRAEAGCRAAVPQATVVDLRVERQARHPAALGAADPAEMECRVAVPQATVAVPPADPEVVAIRAEDQAV